MSKVKKSDKMHYEILYIVPNNFTEEEARGIDEKVQKIITDHEGEVIYSENWGSKKMAYPIKGFSHGYYLLHEFDLWGKDLAEVNKLLRMSSDVLRHQIIRVARRTAEEIARDKADEKKILEEEKKEKESAEEAKEEAKKESSKKKVDLKDLDKKLDDILDSSDLL